MVISWIAAIAMGLYYWDPFAGFAGGAIGMMVMPVGGIVSIVTHPLYARIKARAIAMLLGAAVVALSMWLSYLSLGWLAR